ncbi:MAG: OmpA family protein [Flavobacteriales bacterium]|nr:OmpA family protein [Flavobacteriales bacterium]
MKNSIFKLLLLIPVLSLAQYGSNIEYRKFTKSERKFDSWSVTLYGGIPLMQSADLTSFNNIGELGKDKNDLRIGYDVQLGVTKHITHSVGIQLLYAYGLVHQGKGKGAGSIEGQTKYQSLSLLGDLNLSSLFRRVDNKSPYRWALHAYLGAGVLDYDTKLNVAGYAYNADPANVRNGSSVTTVGVPNGNNGLNERDYYSGHAWTENPFASFFAQTGVGLKFKLNQKFDLEGRVMYVISGDDNFDAGGTDNNDGNDYSNINAFKKSHSDDMITTSLGISYKIGKYYEHLQWFDPLHELYPPKDGTGGGVCMVDKDEDAVCDDLDKQLDTPKGARVDGSGVAMDTDYDGLIDPLDKCPTIPGPVENQGCPIEEVKQPETPNPTPDTKLGNKLPAIEFLLDSDKLTNESQPILDNASKIIKEFFPNDKIVVEGHTDAWGDAKYNQDLSQRRVETVVRYLGTKGVNTANLIPVGKGESDLKLTKCNPASKCTDAENKQNRRVVFKLQ